MVKSGVFVIVVYLEIHRLEEQVATSRDARLNTEQAKKKNATAAPQGSCVPVCSRNQDSFINIKSGHIQTLQKYVAFKELYYSHYSPTQVGEHVNHFSDSRNISLIPALYQHP